MWMEAILCPGQAGVGRLGSLGRARVAYWYIKIKVKAWEPAGERAWSRLRLGTDVFPDHQCFWFSCALCWGRGWDGATLGAGMLSSLELVCRELFIPCLRCSDSLCSVAHPEKQKVTPFFLFSHSCLPGPHWGLCLGLPKWVVFLLAHGSYQPQLPDPCQKRGPSSQRWVPSWGVKRNKTNTVRSAL